MLAVCIIGYMEGGKGAAYPDTFTCDVVPTVEFPPIVTLGQDYVVIATCKDAKVIEGDFVTIHAATIDGVIVLPLSEYVETDTGAEWISPITDSNGQAPIKVKIYPELFGCSNNSFGSPYSMHIHWDGQDLFSDFNVVCPDVNFKYYRQEIPYWEQMKVDVIVKDEIGRAISGINCVANVLSLYEDDNISIKQTIEAKTDSSGIASFAFGTGFLHDLLQGYTYVTVVDCLGGDANYTFTIEETDPQYFKNPLYYAIIFLSENILSILVLLIVAALIIGILFMRAKQKEN